MSTCNCDGSVHTSFTEDLFGDSLLHGMGIYESQFGLATGGVDPRPAACEEAAGQLRAGGEDPCNLDSPDDLQMLYQSLILSHWHVTQQTPASNSLQKSVDITLGTATGSTPITKTPSSGTTQTQAQSGPSLFLVIGFIALLGIGFVFVFSGRG
jgi:hypothetical protein